jgi:hypothetical protein
MPSNRRDFIERLGAAAVLGALPVSVTPAQGREWDMSWVAKLDGIPHKALFDCTDIESGNGVARVGIWESQYQSALGAKPEEIRTVLILRHTAVALTLKQDMWDRFAIGKTENVKSPMTEQETDKNPVLGEGANSDGSLQRFIAKGGIVLACNLALQRYVRKVRAADNVSGQEALKRVADALVPGVILQPSGVFAAVRAGQAGCVYVKAS